MWKVDIFFLFFFLKWQIVPLPASTNFFFLLTFHFFFCLQWSKSNYYLLLCGQVDSNGDDHLLTVFNFKKPAFEKKIIPKILYCKLSSSWIFFPLIVFPACVIHLYSNQTSAMIKNPNIRTVINPLLVPIFPPAVSAPSITYEICSFRSWHLSAALYLSPGASRRPILGVIALGGRRTAVKQPADWWHF